MSQQL